MEDLEQLQLLGRGGYASVYLCRHKKSGDLFALKRVSRSKVATPQQQQRLEAEQFILQEVKSPFLCRGFETFETEEEVALLQEHIEGRPLYECVWKYRDTGKFPEKVAKFFAAQLVLALGVLHAQGYIHRDFKSGNVLVDQAGFAKVIDFGLAKRMHSDEKPSLSERTQSVCGTHYVMAPEIFLRKPCGFAGDWWSLGVVIFEMVAGRPPWEYQCPQGRPLEGYFQGIEAAANALFQDDEGSLFGESCDFSADLKALLRGLLKTTPNHRIGCKGSTEVMHQAWFSDVDWELLKTRKMFPVPYNARSDFNSARVRTPPQNGSAASSSSAESIDPEDNAKYFAEF